MSLDVGYERFVLTKINIGGLGLSISDFFDPSKKLVVNLENFRSLSDGKLMVKENQLMLLNESGTTINFTVQAGLNWFDIRGVSLTHPEFSQWKTFIAKCNHLDISSNERWGLGKYSSRGSIHEPQIYERLKEKYS